MKKISLLLTFMAVIAMTFTSCKDDTQPRLEHPTEFHLNTPALAANTYMLSEKTGIELSVSQANYGMGVVARYTVEISLDEDFSDYRALKEQYTSARFTVPGESLSLALCEMLGYTDKDNYSNAPVPVYVRVVSTVPNCDYSVIKSNIVKLDSVVPYFAVKLADKMWIIGAFPGWDITNDSAPLVETEPESGVYQGTYFIPAGSFQFRFYNELGDWESWSVGSQDDDAPVDITFTNGVYEGPCYVGVEKGDKKGKGSWQVADWEGGTVKFTVVLTNPKKMYVIFEVID